MSHRSIGAVRDAARKLADQSSAKASSARNSVKRFITTAHYAVTLSGVCAIGALAVLYAKPELMNRLKTPVVAPPVIAAVQPAPVKALEVAVAASTPVPAAAAHASPATLDERASRTLQLIDSKNKTAPAGVQQKSITSWISKRYRVAEDATHMFVSASYLTAQELNLDPLLILAVMAIESGFNPFAESPVGAQGLMQVMSKVHHDKFKHLGGVQAALNPVANIKVGARILKEYVDRTGSVEAGLRLYVGGPGFDSPSSYGSRVLAEYRRLKDVAMGKNVPTITTASTAPKKSQRSEDLPADDAESPAETESAPAKEQET